MSPDVIDNRQRRLADRVREFLALEASSVRLAVGYLFLDGLAPLSEELHAIREIEILIGNVVNRLTEEQLREEAAARQRGGEAWVRDQEDVASTLRGNYDRTAIETALNLRRTIEALPRTRETRRLLLTLASRIADGGLKVRLYAHGRMHAKVTLIGYPDGVLGTGLAIVGSSNLTLGSDGHPTEMNIVVRDDESVATLADWYQGLWDVSQDFHRELFDELGQSWAFDADAVR